MTDYRTFSTDELVAAYNEVFGKAIKKGSYTRAKMIDALDAQAKIEEIAKNPLPSFAKNLDAALTQSLAKKTKLEIEPGIHDANPIPAPAAPTPEELLDADRCPLCGGDAANQTAAGTEGTVLGDTCNFCHECGKTYSCLDGSEVEVPAAKTSTKKRRILNPQVKINAKTEACAKEGIEVFYDKAARIWTFTDNTTGGLILHMDSRTFSEFTPAELAAYAAKRRPA